MFLHDKEVLETIVIKALSQKPLTGPEVITIARQKRPAVTRQAIYSCLRILLSKEIAYKANSKYSLNRLWLKKLFWFAKKQLTLADTKDETHTLNLSQGDEMVFKFHNPRTLDSFWAHKFDEVLENHNPTTPVIIYHPHEWFWYARKKPETAFLESLHTRGTLGFFAIGGNTNTDKTFKRLWQRDWLQISTGQTFQFKNNYYLNILDDITFEVTLDEDLCSTIDQIYQTETEESKLTPLISDAASKNYKGKIIIRKNKDRAHKLAKKIKKAFFLPKGFSLP